MRCADFPRAIMRNDGAGFRDDVATTKFPREDEIMRGGGHRFRHARQ